MPRSIGAVLTDRNSGSGLQVKTIKLSYQIWNVLGAIQGLVIKEGRKECVLLFLVRACYHPRDKGTVYFPPEEGGGREKVHLKQVISTA